MSLGKKNTIISQTLKPKNHSWIEDLKKYNSVNQLKKNILNHHPYLELKKLKQVILIGAGPEGERLINILNKNNISIKSIHDDNRKNISKKIFNISVQKVDVLRTHEDFETPIIIASHRPLNLFHRLGKLGFKNISLFQTLQLLYPNIFKPHMFYEKMLDDLIINKNKYLELQDLFSDEISVDHLNAIIGFRMNCNIGCISNIIDWDVYFPEKIVNLKDDEVFIDGGAYNGDSINLFEEKTNFKYQKIFAFEPDPQSAKSLKKKFKENNKVEVISKGMYEYEDNLKFVNDSSRGALFSDTGDISVPVTSVDKILNGQKATYIKMNIEGLELKALNGSKNTIKTWKPRVAISSYHIPSHLWEVPMLIKYLNKNYDIYLRQHDCGVIETVSYGI